MPVADVADPIARPLLSAIFLWGGYQAVRKPEGLANRASGVLERVAPALEDAGVPADSATLVQVNGAVQVAAGSMLALGVAPRLSATVLAATLVPTTIGGHAFWDEEDPQARSLQQVQFAKNLSLLGGLLLAATRSR